MTEKENENLELEDDIKLFFKAFRIILIISMLLLIGTLFQAFFTVGNIQSNSVNDINYTFEENILVDWENPVYDFGRNTRNMTEFTGNFTGTYSFEDETGETGTSITFIDSETSFDGGSEIISSLDGHNEVLQFQDDITPAEDPIATHTISQRTSGTIEFWLRTDDAIDEYPIIALYEDGTTIERIRITAGTVDYTDDNPAWVEMVSFSNNKWYHIKIIWRADDTWDCFVNGGLEVDDQAMENDQTSGVNIFSLYAGGDSADSIFIDGFGESWGIDYNINDNIIPYSYQNETLEINKFEFFNNEDGTAIFPGQTEIPFWDELLTAGKVLNSIPNFYDETGAAFYIENEDHLGIERDFNLPFAELIQINFTFYYGPRYGAQKWFTIIDVDSYDDTLIIRLRMDDDAVQKDLRLSYWNGVSFIEIEDLTDASTMLNITITIVDSIVLLDTRTDIYTFPILSLNKDGLGDIKFETYGGGDYDANAYIYIDSIGVYTNNISLSNDFGNYYYNMSNNFYNKYNNLFTINSIGFFSASMVSSNTSQTFGIFSYQDTTNLSFINLYNPDVYPIPQSFFVIATNSSFAIYSLFITGVILRQDTNIYYPVITDNSIDNNESYFYVSSNRLYYRMITDDDNLEYIQATFTVNAQESTNYSMVYGGMKSYLNLFAEFRVNYDDTSYNSFLFRTTVIYTNQIIPQEKNIVSFVIIITDDDNDVDNTITGYLNSITLLYNPDAGLNIALVNYMSIIPGISLIVVITVIIWGLSKKQVGNMLVVPSIVGTAYLAFISTFIPMWLLFIILVSSGALVYSKWKDLFLVFISFANMILGFLHYGGIVDLWLFYMSFILLIGYIIFVGVKDITGRRVE